MKNNVDLEIARLICAAQIASDAGKYIFDLKIKDDKTLNGKAYFGGYYIKDSLIYAALTLCRNTEKSHWSYSLKREPDQKGYMSNCVIFQYNDTGVYGQVSFHFFKKNRFKKMMNSGSDLKWDNGSSRAAAYAIYKHLGGKAWLRK